MHKFVRLGSVSVVEELLHSGSVVSAGERGELVGIFWQRCGGSAAPVIAVEARFSKRSIGTLAMVGSA